MPAPLPSRPRFGWRRAVLGLLVGATVGVGAWIMADTVADGGVRPLELAVLALFVPTFAWIVVAFWTSLAGFVLAALGRDPMTLTRAAARGETDGPHASGFTPSTATALAVPVYNEDPTAVMARLSAMARSLERLGVEKAFHFHILSDTGDADIARAEEAAWAKLQGTHPESVFFYRRRPENTGRKAGNLGEFCQRCRDDYDFMVVLDADSLMAGDTLVAMVRRMESESDLGLLQTVPIPVRQQTVFGRLVQFSAALQGPMMAAGQAFWHGDSGNYWGHNAIIRLAPFADHAKLPVLSGRPPLGGEILSHDFVEAALLRRAGWRVVLDPSLEGSWEEVPGTLVHYAIRDRRWAQGSLQHLRLLGMPGLTVVNRLHFLMGAMGYVSSALWFLTLVAGTLWVAAPGLASAGPSLPGSFVQLLPPVPETLGRVPLLGATAVILFGPRLLSALITVVRHSRRFGGVLRLSAGVLGESLLSVLLAPVLMLYHTGFVAEIAMGRAVGWTAQERDGATLSWRSAFAASRVPTVAGAIWAGATLWVSPAFFIWMTPIFTGLLLAAPLMRLTSSPAVGGWLRRHRLLLSPSESAPAHELQFVAADLEGTRDPDAREGVLISPHSGAAVHVSHDEIAMYNAERALFDLQRGRPVLLVDEVSGNGSGPIRVLVASVESLDDVGLQRLRSLSGSAPALVVTHHRLHAMGVGEGVSGNGASGAGTAWTVDCAHIHNARGILAMAAHRADGNEASAAAAPATPAQAAGLGLVRLARSIPAVVAFTLSADAGDELADATGSGEILTARVSEVAEFIDAAGSSVVRISDAPVPLPGAEDSHFVLFREAFGLEEHVAIMVGARENWPDPVPVRLHSACLTGDLFGSLRCDCGEQLRGSMEYFRESGGGVLLYLAQEGRGIGLSNKFRAYTLQGTGLDTIDADGTLGFGADERQYDTATGMLSALGVRHVQLLTNNPEKMAALERAGIRVASRQPLHGSLNRHNLPYVEAKVNRAGHWLRAMLAQPLAGD